MSVYSYKTSEKNMVIQATLQTKLACGALTIIIINVCILIAVIAYISKEEMCKLIINQKQISDIKVSSGQSEHKLRSAINKHPWIVAFLILPEHVFIGTATIISTKWTLTTADCTEKVNNYPISKKGFRGGSTFWNKRGYYHFAVKIIPHEKFNSLTMDYNIALIAVSRPFNNLHEKPLALTGSSFKIEESKTAEVVGWTIQTDTNYVDDVLLHIHVKLFSEKYCGQAVYGFENDSATLKSLCISRELGKLENSACIFSSGSALIMDRHLIGLASLGATCGTDSSLSGIYMYLKTVIEWINNTKTIEQITTEVSD